MSTPSRSIELWARCQHSSAIETSKSCSRTIQTRPTTTSKLVIVTSLRPPCSWHQATLPRCHRNAIIDLQAITAACHITHDCSLSVLGPTLAQPACLVTAVSSWSFYRTTRIQRICIAQLMLWLYVLLHQSVSSFVTLAFSDKTAGSLVMITDVSTTVMSSYTAILYHYNHDYIDVNNFTG